MSFWNKRVTVTGSAGFLGINGKYKKGKITELWDGKSAQRIEKTIEAKL